MSTAYQEGSPSAYRLRTKSRATRPPRHPIMGVPIDLVDQHSWLRCLDRWLVEGTPGTAVGVNANLINLARRDPALTAVLHGTQLAYADGQAVVWAARLLGWPVRERLATTDMIHPLCALLVERGASVFLLGGDEGAADTAASQLQARYPGLAIAGTHHGFICDDDAPALIHRINQSGADVLLVGMGDPLQQTWVARHRPQLTPTAVITCGGLFNWLDGRHRRPPAVLVSAGLEWAWRLATEPRRLWRRYMLGNPRFVAALIHELLLRRRVRTIDLVSDLPPSLTLIIGEGDSTDRAGLVSASMPYTHEEAKWS